MTPKLAGAALLVACAACLTLASPARAEPPCWQRLLTDWYDGQIDKGYPLDCYQQAIDHLPTDIEQYSSAREDIEHALQLALAERNRQEDSAPDSGEDSDPGNEVLPPPPGGDKGGGSGSAHGRDKPKGVVGALDKLNPGSADAFPLPLLILGALAVLLVAAGVAGMLWRRFQGQPPGV